MKLHRHAPHAPARSAAARAQSNAARLPGSLRTTQLRSGSTAVLQRHATMVFAQATARAGMGSMRELSAQMKDMRRSMDDVEDARLKALMAGLRGSNINDSDFASSNVRMNLVEIVKSSDDQEQLPLTYDPDAIAAYWSRRPVSIITRILQLLGIAGGFISKLVIDAAMGRLSETEVDRAIDLRNIMTSLGPAYIKLGQALSIRPDLLSPAAMNELQKLCDKVPSFDNKLAMQVVQDELGRPWYDVYAELTPEPIAAASLGQVYKGRLKTGEVVAVKVQRPYVLETVTIDLYIIRTLGQMMRRWRPDVTARADIVALLDEWAARFFDELDYIKEGQSAARFAEMMAKDLPQVVVPKTYTDYTSRRVLTSEWLEGEKLSQSRADDVGTLVNIGVICYLKQLLEFGFFHSDPHPGNLIRTPDGRLAILDFGLMSEVDDEIKFGMIEAIAHLIHRDYEAIVEDFVTLQFIAKGTDLRPILPVLAKVFDQALEGGGAKNINFQELAADLAQITFDYPFRIPPYFALIIRAISVLEGIALLGNPDFALVDEAYPYISKRLLTDESPRLRASLRYMVYGRSNVFDADRLIDLLIALENYSVASQSARGDLDVTTGVRVELGTPTASNGAVLGGGRGGYTATMPSLGSSSGVATGSGRAGGAVAAGTAAASDPLGGGGFLSFPPLFPFPGLGDTGADGFGGNNSGGLVPALRGLVEMSPLMQMMRPQLVGAGAGAAGDGGAASVTLTGDRATAAATAIAHGEGGNTREALRFILSPEGAWFREFVMDELVKSIDALSRDQVYLLVQQLGLQAVMVPVLLPGSRKSAIPLAPVVTEEDRQIVENMSKIFNFLTRGQSVGSLALPGVATEAQQQQQRALIAELLPVLPTVATEILPQLLQRLVGRITARLVRDLYV